MEKTRVWSSDKGGVLQVCGLNVPDAVGKAILLPRPMKRKLRVALHQLWKENEHLSDEKRSAARGTVAYAYSVTGDVHLLADCSKQVSKIASLVASDANSFLDGWRQR